MGERGPLPILSLDEALASFVRASPHSVDTAVTSCLHMIA